MGAGWGTPHCTLDRREQLSISGVTNSLGLEDGGMLNVMGAIEICFL